MGEVPSCERVQDDRDHCKRCCSGAFGDKEVIENAPRGRDPDMVDLGEPNALKMQSRSRGNPSGSKSGTNFEKVEGETTAQVPTPMLMQQVKTEQSSIAETGFPHIKCDSRPSQGSTPSREAIMGLHEVLDHSIWCWYCLCAGCGFIPRQAHCKFTWQCLCGHGLFEGTPCCAESCCSCIHHWLCCACINEFPPQEGSPCCMLAGDGCLDYCPVHWKYPAGKAKEDPKKMNGFAGDVPLPPSEVQSARESGDACLCCCCGFAQFGVLDCSSYATCCCSRFACNLLPSEECCNCLLISCWLSAQCWLPPGFAHNPVCACLGLRLRQPVKDKPHPNSIL